MRGDALSHDQFRFIENHYKRPFSTRMGGIARDFRVPPGLCIKTSVQPLILKWFFIHMQVKLIFTRKVVHLASFWKWGFLELGSGLLVLNILAATSKLSDPSSIGESNWKEPY